MGKGIEWTHKCPYCPQWFILRRSMLSHKQWHERPERILRYTGRVHIGKIKD